ncbi:hypothetical protein KJ633_01745 [bacterium]|nr:hypothetical protein [bacterium]MBU3955163.1 hypothetical protein [bacterium]
MKAATAKKSARHIAPAVAATIGIYDGVHAGHRVVLKELLKCPGRKKVFVFFSNPKKSGDIVTNAMERKNILAEMGLDSVMLKIEQYWKMSAGDFLKKVLIKKYRVRRLVIGEDFVFGRKREGTVGKLKKWARESGVAVSVVKTKTLGGCKISTTRIKKLISHSKTFLAAQLMGRPYTVSGKKVRGKGIAGTLGFPTVNLIPEKHKAVPEGVFTAEVICKAGRFPAVVNSGSAPTFGIKKVLEFYALSGYSPEILKCGNFKILFGKFIRKQKKFTTKERLAARIKKDVQFAVASGTDKSYYQRIRYGKN